MDNQDQQDNPIHDLIQSNDENAAETNSILEHSLQQQAKNGDIAEAQLETADKTYSEVKGVGEGIKNLAKALAPQEIGDGASFVVKGLKGDPGHTPTNEELTSLIKPLIPEPIKGDDGHTPTEDELINLIIPLIPDPIPGEDGKDYILTEDDKKEIALSIEVPIVEKVIVEKTEVIKEKKSEITATEIKKKLESLKNGLDYESLSNTPDINKIISLSRQASKTVSLVELDDVDYSGLSFVNGKYVLGSGGGGGTVDSVVAGTGISVDNTDPVNPVVTNSAPDQTVAFTGGTNVTIGGTYPNFTITDNSGTGTALASGALTQFVGNNNWKVWYSDGSGDVQELALGAAGTFLQSNGASSVPSFAVPAGSGDVSKVGTPVNNQVGVWTGDGTIEGTTGLIFDSTTDALTVAGSVTTPMLMAKDSSGMNFHSQNMTDIALLGAGNTANVVWYGSHNFSTATQDTIAAFTGAGKTLGSLATATYPSLTELSYVKGLTSAVQTQLGARELLTNKSTDTTLGTSDTLYPSQKAVKTYVDNAVVGLLDYRGAYDASVNTFPASGGSGTAGAILKGDMWIISVAGTLGGVAVGVGDSVIANTDTPGQTSTNWNVLDANISYVPENVANKVTSISGASTDTQYPSAKLTYDQLALKQATITFGTGVQTALGVNIGSAGAPVLFNGALGTPSSGTLTNATGLPAASVLAGTFGTGAYIMDTSLTVPILNGSSAANGDITINGTSNATKTSSYVILQATGGNVGIGTTAPAAAMELASGGLFVSNYGSGVSVPGGGSIGMYLRGATSTSPFGFSAAGTGNISATAPLFYYSWVGASATKLGFSSYDASAIKDYIAFDYTTGNFEVKAPAIEATSSTTIGTTTLADKFGNAYLTNGADLYPDNDVYGLWNRFVNYGFTPDEHWGQNADELTWTGWATYTSYVTPASITTNLSSYSVAHNSGVKSAFRYRAAATGAAIFLRARATVTFLNTGGLMIDDGVDNVDGNGANNFYRVYIKQTALGGAFQVFEEYRTGGGAVTTNTGPTISYGDFSGIGLFTQGTRWTAWTAAPFTFGEAQSSVQFTGGSPSFTWTPARVGLYAKFSATDFGRRAVWDWYDEATS